MITLLLQDYDTRCEVTWSERLLVLVHAVSQSAETCSDEVAYKGLCVMWSDRRQHSTFLASFEAGMAGMMMVLAFSADG